MWQQGKQRGGTLPMRGPGLPVLILKLGDPDSCRPRHYRDTHRKNVRRSNGIWESCSDTEHARMSQCLRRLVLVERALDLGLIGLVDCHTYVTRSRCPLTAAGQTHTNGYILRTGI